MIKSKLTFHGGVDTVTGANFLLELPNQKILVDCGMTQGAGHLEDRNWDNFPYEPKDIEVLFITHAHIDHIGRVGKLVRDGFNGHIISTPPTKELAGVMLKDALGVLTYKHKEGGKKPYFNTSDLEKALSLWETREYGETYNLKDGVTVNFNDAGHILGSTMLSFKGESSELLFSGDLGNGQGILTSYPDSFSSATYVVMESVYGDRVHEDPSERKKRFAEIISRIVETKGALLIPAFSLERTQIMLYELNELIESGKVPAMPVFLDSPLAIKVTNIYRNFEKYFAKEVRDDIAGGDDIFSFPHLDFTKTPEDSKSIKSVVGPKIIIAGAGMSHAGRIIFHEAEYLHDERNTLLIVGYQSPGSFGRRLLEGQKDVTLLGKKIKVRAHVEKLLNYSSHADRDDLLALVEGSKDSIKKVYVAMGEDSSRTFFAQRVKDYLGIDAQAPRTGDSVEIVL